MPWALCPAAATSCHIGRNTAGLKGPNSRNILAYSLCHPGDLLITNQLLYQLSYIGLLSILKGNL